ncbi:MAG: MFS transporter [Desulfuromonadaceae bacterium]
MNDTQGLKSLLAINVLAGCASGIMLLALPLYTLSLHASATEMGLISSMAGIGRMLIIVPSGMWADRYGTRRMFVISTLLCAALTLAIPWVYTAIMLMVIMFFQGMAQSVGFMTLQAGFLKRMKYLEATQVGWQRSATQLGFYLLGPFAAAGLLGGDNYFPVFLSISVLLLAGVAVVVYRSQRGITEIREYTSRTPAEDFSHMRGLLSDSNLLIVLALELLNASAFAVFRTFMAPVALNVFHLPLQAISWLIITQGSLAMATLFWGSILFKGHSARWCFNISAATTLIGTFVMATSGTTLLLWLGVALYGSGTGMVGYCGLVRLNMVEGEKGKIAALYSLSVAIGTTLGPILGGMAGETFGLQASFLSAIALFIPVMLIQSFIATSGSSCHKESEILDQVATEQICSAEK